MVGTTLQNMMGAFEGVCKLLIIFFSYFQSVVPFLQYIKRLRDILEKFNVVFFLNDLRHCRVVRIACLKSFNLPHGGFGFESRNRP